MKSKLTLRLDEDLKARAKDIASARGTSVSKLVEDYFRLLSSARDAASRDTVPQGERADSEHAENTSDAGDGQSPDEDLSPRIRALRERLGTPAPPVTPDKDTHRWVKAAAKKHA